MNTIIDLFNDHKSERSFTDKAIDDATLDRIISTAWNAPTSVHSQQVSAIVTRDAQKRAEISPYCGRPAVDCQSTGIRHLRAGYA
jgi:FMN reductase [NAD(P)H]